MTTDPARVTLVVSPYLAATRSILSAAGEALVVDPGLEVHAEVEKALAAQALTPVGIIVTHGHLDHVGDVSLLAQKWGVPVYVGEADAYRLVDPMAQLPSAFTGQIKPMWDARAWTSPADTRTVTTGDTVAVGPLSLEARSYPGHTEGSTIWVLDAPVEIEARVGVTGRHLSAPGVAFTGDVLFAGTIGRTDLLGGDPEQMKSSLVELRAYALEHPDLAIIPGHGPASTFRDELGTNRFLSFSF